MSLEGTIEPMPSDDAVSFSYTVRNVGSEPVELTFTDSGHADVAVLEDGIEIWRHSEGRMYAQVMGQERLDPDESRTYELEWTDPDPGSYTAVCELRASDHRCEARTTFSV